MGKLLYTDNVGFSMNDWENESIKKVFAGTDCIMAITEDGRVLQKIKNKERAARTEDWTRIEQIALSKWMGGVAIGLVSDGTCLISKRPVRCCCENWTNQHFEYINETIKSWTNIVQVAVSDAFFALDSSGHVHYSYYSLRNYDIDDYSDVTSWRNVFKIVTGSQSSIFGITFDGKVLCSGGGCKRGAHGDLREKLCHISDASDIYPTGSECQCILIEKKDGTIVDERGKQITYNIKKGNGEQVGIHHNLRIPKNSLEQVMDGTFFYTVVARTVEGTLFSVLNREMWDWENRESIFPKKYNISSFALGDIGYGGPFVIAVGEHR